MAVNSSDLFRRRVKMGAMVLPGVLLARLVISPVGCTQMIQSQANAVNTVLLALSGSAHVSRAWDDFDVALWGYWG